jgi:hypothetical protein
MNWENGQLIGQIKWMNLGNNFGLQKSRENFDVANGKL